MRQKHSGRDKRAGLLTTSVLAAAFALDKVGEPPLSLHPVVWYGKLIRQLKKSAPSTPEAQLLYGAGMLATAGLPVMLVSSLWNRMLQKTINSDKPILLKVAGTMALGASLKPFFALDMLEKAGGEVRLALEADDLPGAREALRSLVSRDRSALPSELCAAAAVESLAENLSDSLVAPLFYYTLFGLPGAALYRLFNTFDSMVGYHGQYEYLGKIPARFDDVLNLFPARLTALLIILLAPCYGGSAGSGIKTWQQDAGKTESPNAGHPMAAASGTLEVTLEKPSHYLLGATHGPATTGTIRQAEQMVRYVGLAAFVLAAAGKRYVKFS